MVHASENRIGNGLCLHTTGPGTKKGIEQGNRQKDLRNIKIELEFYLWKN